jgi:hypothetical protein
MRADQTRLKSISSQSIIVDRSPYNNLAKPLYTVCAFPYSSQTSRPGAGLDTQRACKLKPPAKFSYEATRFFIAEKLLSFFLFTAIRRSSTQLKISLNPNLLSIQALFANLLHE